jgi:hypothetical protein
MQNRTYFPDDLIAREGVPPYLVATPYYGGGDLDHLKCIERLRGEYPSVVEPWRPDGHIPARSRLYQIIGCAYIDVARATAAAHCLERGFAGLLFIDHDIVFDPQDAVALMRQAERERAIVFAMYSMRKPGGKPIGCFSPEVTEVKFFEGGGLYPAIYGGFGLCAIPRFALEAVGRELLELETGFSKVKALFGLRSGVPDWPELFDAFWKRSERLLRLDARSLADSTDRSYFRALFAESVAEISKGEYGGEDTSFFHRARRAGIRVLADTRPRIFHKGSYLYGIEDIGVRVPRGRTLEVTFEDFENGQHPIFAADGEKFEGCEAMAVKIEPHPVEAEA